MKDKSLIADFKLTKRQKQVYLLLEKHSKGRLLFVNGKAAVFVTLFAQNGNVVERIRSGIIRRMIRKGALVKNERGNFSVLLPGMIKVKKLPEQLQLDVPLQKTIQ